MIRIMLVDDHPALRAGLETVLRSEPDMEPVGAATDPREAWPLHNRTCPDLVLLDYHLPGHSSLQLCRKFKSIANGPRVIIYTAYTEALLGLAARLAGADGLVAKRAPAGELLEAIRAVARGESALPPVTREDFTLANAFVTDEDRPLVGMLSDGTSTRGVAEALRIDPAAAGERIDHLLEQFEVELGTTVR